MQKRKFQFLSRGLLKRIIILGIGDIPIRMAKIAIKRNINVEIYGGKRQLKNLDQNGILAIKKIQESKIKYKDFQIFLWSNLNCPGDYNTTHDHPDCHMSGVYYVKLPKGDCGKLRMYNPMYSYNYNSDGYNPPYKQPRVEINSKEGALLIFRAPLLHDVTRNNTKEDRISLSFNIRFIGGCWGQ